MPPVMPPAQPILADDPLAALANANKGNDPLASLAASPRRSTGTTRNAPARRTPKGKTRPKVRGLARMAPEINELPERRPGGLTALAVLNIIGSVGHFLVGCAVLLFGAVFKGFTDVTADAAKSASSANNEAADQVSQAGNTVMGVTGVIGFVFFILAIALMVSAIGYFQRSRVMGYWIGHVYAGLALIVAIISICTGGQIAGVIVAVIYPILTLILLNTSFRKSFA